MGTPERLTLAQARRIALRAQGLDRPRHDGAASTSAPTVRQVAQLVRRLGLLQIDSVNVLARAHLLPVFSRLGPYDEALLARASGRTPRRLVEYWAHEASFVPPETYRLLGWRRRAWREQAWGSATSVLNTHPGLVDEIRAIVADRGPVTAREVQAEFEAEHPRTTTQWGWNWSVSKRALELLFFMGEVAAAGRTTAFERRYDLTSRVLPPAVLAAPEPAETDAVRTLVEIGARAHGIGTVGCFADYFRIKAAPARRAVDELVADGVLVPVEVVGWPRPTYLHRDAVVPRSATGRALLCPFDPLVFERRRLEELFGTRYRIEIYTPAHQRVHGYYVLPFLLGDRIVARVDLKSDRRRGMLLVQSAHAESHEGAAVAGGPGAVAEELAAELRLMAGWLGLGDVQPGATAHGDLVGPLTAALASP